MITFNQHSNMISAFGFRHIFKSDYKPIQISRKEYDNLNLCLSESMFIKFKRYVLSFSPNGFTKGANDPQIVWLYTNRPTWSGFICDEVYVINSFLKDNRSISDIFQILEDRKIKRL